MTRLELRDQMPGRVQLTALAQQLPSLEEVAFVKCNLEELQWQQRRRRQQQGETLGAPPLPSSVHSLVLRSCRTYPPGNPTPPLSVVVPLLQSPASVHHLEADDDRGTLLPHLHTLPNLTRLTYHGDVYADVRPLLAHPRLTHVTLRNIWPAALERLGAPLHEGLRWRQLTLTDGDASGLRTLLARARVDRLVFQGRIRDWSSPSGEWDRLTAAARAAGTVLVCQPDGEGRFTIDGRLYETLCGAYAKYCDDHGCGCYSNAKRCEQLGVTWAHERRLR